MNFPSALHATFPFREKIHLNDIASNWKERLLYYSQSFPFAAVYDSCESRVDQYGQYEWLMGVANRHARTFTEWKNLKGNLGKWWMGVLPYELKTQFEPSVSSLHEPWINWPEVAFFQPELLVQVFRNEQTIHLQSHDESLLAEVVSLLQTSQDSIHWVDLPNLQFDAGYSQQAYQDQILRIKAHIREGDFYEINLTQAFRAKVNLEQPAAISQRLKEISPVPFAGYFRFETLHLICASPERFLQKKGDQLCSQPIKGTAPRSPNPTIDFANQSYLQTSEKEQAENVMIVDLTRHDLQRSSLPGSVSVPSLFEIQAFPQVFQMVSTVVSRLRPDLSPAEAIAHTFPPGSMTGAPKVMTMNMIDQFEPEGRGAYAGSLGYFTPEGDFDFNVIIRSLIYHQDEQKLSYHVGGAITHDSDPAQEFQETLHKAEAIRQLFAHSAPHP